MDKGADGVVAVLEAARMAVSAAPRPRGTSRKIASAEPAEGVGPGWFRVDGRVSARELELLADGHLRQGDDDLALLHDVLEVASDGEEPLLRVSQAAPAVRMDAVVPSGGQRRVLEGLAKGLARRQGNPLLDAFRRRALSEVRAGPDLISVSGWATLKPSQQEAVRACCSPGLQVVWGPPGTGKTHVTAAAISHLVRRGHRVLLVSSTNTAVDTALQGVVSILGPEPGRAVRVGNVTLPELARNDDVRLDRLVAARTRAAQGVVDELVQRLDALSAERELAQAQAELQGFDAEAARAAAARVARVHRFQEVQRQQERTADAISSALAVAADLRAERARQVRCAAAGAQAAAQVRLAESMRSSRWTGVVRRAYWQRRCSRCTAALGDAERSLARAEARARTHGTSTEPLVDRPFTQVVSELGEAEQTLRALLLQRSELATEAAALEAGGPIGPWDESLPVGSPPLLTLHDGLPEMRRRAHEERPQQARLLRERDAALEDLRRRRRSSEGDIVREASVVATTLTQLTLRPWLGEAAFDHVIIDEAAAVPLPHVMHAVAHARQGAVLVGDYLQNGPIVDDVPGGDEVQRIFGTDCFGFFALTDPESARRRAGCVVLTDQFRFGDVLTELANRVAYRGLLQTATSVAADIVVITVDGLPEDIGAIRREPGRQAGWWVIGALLARALAEHHGGDGARDAFGVVVPYKLQSQATQAALDDSALARLTPAGTSHAFQGRQFTTVLADLVEDGRGWIASARLGGRPYEVDGVRLFNVAATRARTRLYVLLTRRALEGATSGPLMAVRTMVEDGRASRVDADSLLGMFGDAPPPSGGPEADLLAALSPFVRVAGLHDEQAAIAEVVARIDAAASSVWCWSAWVGRHGKDIVDALVRAQDRRVDVRVMARPGWQVQGTNAESLAALAERLNHVVHVRDMHQKLVVVDGNWTVMGSLNVLSHGRTSSSQLRDVMVTMEGRRFAERLLAQEMATELSTPRRCPVCRATMTECGLVGSVPTRDWAWFCDAWPKATAHRRPFPRSTSSVPRRNASA